MTNHNLDLRLVEMWPEYLEHDPEGASNAIDQVDQGELQSLEFYLGFKESLEKAAAAVDFKDPAKDLLLAQNAYVSYRINELSKPDN